MTATFRPIDPNAPVSPLQVEVEDPQVSTLQYVISAIQDAVVGFFLWIAAFFADCFSGGGAAPRLPSASPLPSSVPPQPSPREDHEEGKSLIIRPTPRRPSSGEKTESPFSPPPEAVMAVIWSYSTLQELHRAGSVSTFFRKTIHLALRTQYTQISSLAAEVQKVVNKPHFSFEITVPNPVTLLAVESLTHRTLLLLQGVPADKLSKTDSSTLKSLQQRQQAEGHVVEVALSHAVISYYCGLCPQEELDDGEGNMQKVERLCPHIGVKQISSEQSEVAIVEALAPLHSLAALKEGVPCRLTLGEKRVWARPQQQKWHGFLSDSTAPGTFPEAREYLLKTAE